MRYSSKGISYDCDFKIINMVDVMFYDDASWSVGISMKNVQIDIIGGTVYRGSHLIKSPINIKNVSIQTNQLNTEETKGIFNFESLDVVDIINITILYIYDASLHCEYDTTINNSIINAKCDSYLCKNPITFINNIGIVNIDGIKVNTEIFYGEIQPTYNSSHFNQFVYKYIGDAFILNHGIMNISNGQIINTVCYNFIFNTNELSIVNTKVSQSANGEYNPNDLHSNTIILQFGGSALYIYNGDFIGSYYSILLCLGLQQ